MNDTPKVIYLRPNRDATEDIRRRHRLLVRFDVALSVVAMVAAVLAVVVFT